MVHIAQIKGGRALLGDVYELKGTRFLRRIDHFTVTQETQTVFELGNVPINMPVILSINGVSYLEDIDYTVDREEQTVTWINEEIRIEEDSNVAIEYFVLNPSGVLPSSGSGSGNGGSGDSGEATAVTYDDTALRQQITTISNRVTNLENRTDNDTVYDDTALQEKVAALELHTDALDSSIESLESRADNDTIYDDTAIKTRVSKIETQLGGANAYTLGKSVPNDAVFTDTVYDDTALSNRVASVETKVGTFTLGKSVPANAIFTDTVYDDTSLVNRVDALTTKVSNLETQMSNVLTRLSTLEGYFTNGVAKEAIMAYSVPNEKKTENTDTHTAIWYEVLDEQDIANEEENP